MKDQHIEKGGTNTSNESGAGEVAGEGPWQVVQKQYRWRRGQEHKKSNKSATIKIGRGNNGYRFITLDDDVIELSGLREGNKNKTHVEDVINDKGSKGEKVVTYKNGGALDASMVKLKINDEVLIGNDGVLMNNH